MTIDTTILYAGIAACVLLILAVLAQSERGRGAITEAAVRLLDAAIDALIAWLGRKDAVRAQGVEIEHYEHVTRDAGGFSNLRY